MPHAWSHHSVLLNCAYEGPQNVPWEGKTQGRFWQAALRFALVLLFSSFLAAALASQRFFYALLFARLEIKGVTLNLLNNVLLLDLTLEAAQGVLERLALLNPYFRQPVNTPKLVPTGLICYPNVPPGSQVKTMTLVRRLAAFRPVEPPHSADINCLEAGLYGELNLPRSVRSGHQELRILDEFPKSWNKYVIFLWLYLVIIRVAENL